MCYLSIDQRDLLTVFNVCWLIKYSCKKNNCCKMFGWKRKDWVNFALQDRGRGEGKKEKREEKVWGDEEEQGKKEEKVWGR